MRTWSSYKEEVKAVDKDAKDIIEEMEGISEIISTIISTRNELGISQRELAKRTGLSQSTIARIESNAITPKLETILTLFKNLGLKLSVNR